MSEPTPELRELRAEIAEIDTAVLEALNELELPVPVLRVGWPDAFIEHGKVEALREKYGLTAEAALEKARSYLAAMESRRMALR